MTAYILNLLANENERELKDVVSNLKPGTPVCELAFLAWQLAKDESDFDSLTDPKNLPVYQRIMEVARESNVVLPPYVALLMKISGDKKNGLSGNQGLAVFLDEYDKFRGTVSPKGFLQQYRKLLSREERKLVEYIFNHQMHELHPKKKELRIPAFESDMQAAEWFFEHNGDYLNSLCRFIGFFKDVCHSPDVDEFCDFLRNNLYEDKNCVFDTEKSELLRFISKTVLQKSLTENIKLYKDIASMLTRHIVCQRSLLSVFTDGQGNVLFCASENGSKKRKLPEVNVPVTVGVLKRNEQGIVTEWNWKGKNEAEATEGMIEKAESGNSVKIEAKSDFTFDNERVVIRSHEFQNRTDITSLIIPNGITAIGKWAFSGCISLKSLVVPDSVSEIEEGAFCGCTSLKQISIPENVKIGKIAFLDCEIISFSHPYLKIKNGFAISGMGSKLLYMTKQMSHVEIPNLITAIGERAFLSCKSIKSVNIRNSVTEIGSLAFAGCTSITSVTVPKRLDIFVGEIFPDSKIQNVFWS